MKYYNFFLILLLSLHINEIIAENECDFGYYDEETEKCYGYVTTYKGDCSINEQCAWFNDTNIICSERAECVCKEGYRWFLGKCSPFVGFGEECNDEIQCFDGYDLKSLNCTNNVCVCSDDYYERENGKDCRKIATETCALSSDCASNEICSNRGCVTVESATIIDYTEKCYPDLKSEIKADVINCDDNSDCTEVNTECFEGNCVCKPGYFLYNDECIGELGVSDSCTCRAFQGASCDENNACYCLDNYFSDEYNQRCYKPATSTVLDCVNSVVCSTFGPNAYCYFDDSSDVIGTCKCSSYAILNDNYYCEIVDNVTGCLRDNDCNFAHSLCKNEECVCKDGYTYDAASNKCLSGGLGSSCSSDVDCGVNNSTCNSNYECACTDGFFAANQSCYEYLDTLNAYCLYDEQCTNILNTECSGNHCVCKDTYSVYNDVECVKNAGENNYCTNAKECKVSNEELVCRSSICQCAAYFTLENGTCIRSSQSRIGGNFVFILLVISIFRVFN